MIGWLNFPIDNIKIALFVKVRQRHVDKTSCEIIYAFTPVRHFTYG